MARGRSQSSILLTKSPAALSGPPVIILGDHIARVLTNSGAHTERERENHPPSAEPRGAIPSYFLCP